MTGNDYIYTLQANDWTLNGAVEDGEFRTRRVADPKAAIASEVDVNKLEGRDIVVHEDSATTFHLVLLPSPQFTEAEMEAFAGGGPHKGYYW